ncbi:OB-fold nucleic acid binding domain-containing protein [Intrasporangium sp.]|uniref:OB-fold nucleic acid binding domain-containing protein n=1 Tax=Intrasporangium sp. TaxID=1925024 RepID=UPI0029396843|nr:OB-fold nucleic acid binding domain-containing protein [Intrasporangium sp.]MDV3220880.1 OB-fold nucleic acid binding domain-containing protein [Intrasporangium sp.]
MTSGTGSRIRRLADRLRREPASAHETAETPPRQTDAGLVPIREARPRARVTVAGEVRTVALRPRVDVPALDVELWDGVDAIHLVWLGRRSIPGISPGIRLRATGRVTVQRRTLTIFNPAYEIVGSLGPSHE